MNNINTRIPKLLKSPSISLRYVWLSSLYRNTVAITNISVFVKNAISIANHLFSSFLNVQQQIKVDIINENKIRIKNM
ncbi:hypothetical protein [Bacillus sp. FSL K6-3431]|uniref:hypothetical protein n=1 Tax=Bacillus sp. FSL K6-3431 TaxID=2921500 RepID=UPI0030FB285D